MNSRYLSGYMQSYVKYFHVTTIFVNYLLIVFKEQNFVYLL
jgi:hypothetical protein